ncbi:transport permease protein [Sphaerisporangium melleum]|uniref:Transport permease protein n=1 Tax=Sphaerisporangium melleum TaxID=321316 RepID=A0A917VPW3_9ACTN|nr:ABC transporter permease [Sphaerisporangium melleum]GGL02300.1 transport permease protein [Sphaerisporangium melleum]GII72231.1 transport permease protein [Sphaerisporangium melleum]
MAQLTAQVSARSTLAVLERGLTLYRRLWAASALSTFLLPVLFLISIGMGVGGYVGEVGGVDYLSWIVPGVLASTAFQMAVGECTYFVLGDFKWSRAYHAMAATPVQPGDMVCGWLAYVVIRVEIAVVVFLAVTSLFGALRSPWAVLTPLVCALVALASAAPTMAFAASIDHDSYFALLFRFVMIPASLFSGVFFPVEQLPALVRPLAYLSPLWHGVELDRAATLGAAPPWPVAAHLACLLAFAAAGTLWAFRAFRKRLQD